ncbi:PAS domain-containing protein, partial [Methylobacterium sp. J-070]|nr:PAS domain-containing protein [Methylobacterium sp. J-070]
MTHQRAAPLASRSAGQQPKIREGTTSFGGTHTHADQAAKLDVLDRSQAVIEFAPDGTILTANANFLTAMGYTLPEVQGQH